MSSNNTKRSAAWSRLFAGTLIGLAFVLMVVAGVNTRARNAGDERNQVGNENVAEAFLLALNVDGQRRTSRKMPPPPPPEPNQPDQPAQPRQMPPPPPPEPNQPDERAQPRQMPPPPPPAQETPPTPPTPASAPNPASPPNQPAPATPPSQFAPRAVPTILTPPTPAAAPTAPSPATTPKRQKKDQEGKGNLIEAPHPEYPVEARRDNVSGTVTVEIEIDEDGNVASARAASGPEALRAAAVKAAYQARFKPAMVNGKPVKVSAALTYNFVIDNCNGPRCSEL